MSAIPNPSEVQRDLPSGTVTFLFSDIEGSTERWESHRAQMEEALERHDAIMHAAFNAHGGHVFKTMGDAFCVGFRTVPDAIGAALDAQRAIAAQDFSAVEGIKVRMAIHVGLADERGGDYFGPSVNRVARMLAIGHGSQVLVSGAAADLAQGEMPAQVALRDLGAHRLKDLTHPEQVYQLIAPDLPQNFFALRSLETLPNNLPLQVTSFVGREQDAEEIERMLESTRLLTLVGTGGLGKTRLSLQVGANLLDRYADGVWFVEFAPLADAGLVPATVAAIFGFAEQPGRTIAQAIVAGLRAKTALLIFDNCEHLVAEVATLADAIIRGCPNVRILASSREGLTIAGEVVHRLASLPLPPAMQNLTAAQARTYGSVALFIDRANAANTRFAMTDENAPAVVEICRRLDGIALALELAAARVKVLSVEQLAAKLDERFRLLTGGSRSALPRQQTMRALIDWSHDLLSPAEQTIFRRVAVFAGGWTLEAASEIVSDETIEAWDVIDVLSALVDKSMVVAELAEREQRYRLLESTRQYAVEKLEASGESDSLRERHARYYLGIAERGHAEQDAIPMGVWIAPMIAEFDNMRFALDWFLTERQDPVAAATLIWLFEDVFQETGRPAELWRWCERALEGVPAGAAPQARAQLMTMMATTSDVLGKGVQRRSQLISEALDLFEVSGDQVGMARAHLQKGLIFAFAGRNEEARPHLVEALARARAHGDRRLLAGSLAAQLYLENDLAVQRSILRDAIAHYRSAGDGRGAIRVLTWLAEKEFHAGDLEGALLHVSEAIALGRKGRAGTNYFVVALMNCAAYHAWMGNTDEAKAFARESIALVRELQMLFDLQNGLQHLASVSVALGDAQRAARLAGFVDTRLLQIDEQRQLTEQMLYDRLMASLRERLSEQDLAALMAEGATFTEDEAIDEALAF